VARIFPAYWVCLIATAAIFAPIAYARQNGGIDGYLTTGGVTPINYVILNASIKIGSFGIGDTLRSVSFPSAWDGSLWTLYYEFSCYLLVGALGIFGWWRRSPLPIAAAFVLSVALAANSALLSPYFGNNPDVANFMELAPFFLGGALIQMLKRRLPLHWLGAAVGLLGIAGALHLSLTWGLQLAAPLLAYVLLWVASIVPSPEVVRHNDISYGVYIYAFPMQQLLATFGMQHHGPILFTLAAMILTLPFATASWLLVEKPIMRRARRADRTGAPALVGATISERER
jgi:peptidoglycan/LPS O-acetylase OafA/YrhL